MVEEKAYQLHQSPIFKSNLKGQISSASGLLVQFGYHGYQNATQTHTGVHMTCLHDISSEGNPVSDKTHLFWCIYKSDKNTHNMVSKPSYSWQGLLGGGQRS